MIVAACFDQDPFNKVQYQLIGDDSGPSYFVLDQNTGEVKVRDSVNLPADTSINYMVSFELRQITLNLPNLSLPVLPKLYLH